MRIGIDVDNRHEGDALVRAIEDPLLKAAVVISGMLADLSTDDRDHVLSLVGMVNARVAVKTNGRGDTEPRLHYAQGGSSPE